MWGTSRPEARLIEISGLLSWIRDHALAWQHHSVSLGACVIAGVSVTSLGDCKSLLRGDGTTGSLPADHGRGLERL